MSRERRFKSASSALSRGKRKCEAWFVVYMRSHSGQTNATFWLGHQLVVSCVEAAELARHVIDAFVVGNVAQVHHAPHRGSWKPHHHGAPC